MRGLTPSELIVWTYAIVFAATAAAAFLGMFKKIEVIKEKYVNRLVYVLIAEILVGGAAHATRALAPDATAPGADGDQAEMRPRLEAANAKVKDLEQRLQESDEQRRDLQGKLDRTKAELEAPHANELHAGSGAVEDVPMEEADQSGLYAEWCVQQLATPRSIADVDRAKQDLVRLVQTDDTCADALPTTRAIVHLELSKVDGQMLCSVVPVAGGPSRAARDCLRRLVRDYAKRRLQEGDEWKCCIRLDPMPA